MSQKPNSYQFRKEYGEKWLDHLISIEEFLLYEDEEGRLDGIGKFERLPNQIEPRELFPIEEEVYKTFFDWLITSTVKDSKTISKIDFVAEGIQIIDEEWWQKSTNYIKRTIEEIMDV